MAKLNGVVLTAEAIEYNGVKYAKVEDKAQVGDIVRSECNNLSHFPNGAFYSVSSNASATFVVDEDGDKYCRVVGDEDFTVFRKVTEPVTEQAPVTPQQYREAKREANVGECIKIVKCADARYQNGDEFEVDEVIDSRVLVKHPRGNNNGRAAVYHSEYVVLEPITQPSDDLIVVDGVTYRKVDREPKVGDFVYATESINNMSEGKVYGVTSVDSDGDAYFRNDREGINLYPFISVGRILVERVADQPQTTEQLAAEVEETKRKLAEAEKQLAEKQAEEAKIAATNRLKVGEYAKVQRGYRNGCSSNGCSVDGDVVKITKDDKSHVPFRTEHLSGKYAGWHYIDALVRATDEEVAEAKRKLAQAEEAAKWAKLGRKVGEFHGGDVVVIIANTNFSNNKIGDMGVVGEKSPRTGEYRVDTGRETRVNWTRPNEIKLIAPVESVVNLTVGGEA